MHTRNPDKMRKPPLNVKTNSYTKAVELAIKKGMWFGNDFYMDRWRSQMINTPRITNFREI